MSKTFCRKTLRVLLLLAGGEQEHYFQSIEKRTAYIFLAIIFYLMFGVIEVIFELAPNLMWLRGATILCFAVVCVLLRGDFGKRHYQTIILIMCVIHNAFHIFFYCRIGTSGYLMGMINAIILVPIALELSLFRTISMILITLILFNLLQFELTTDPLSEVISLNLFIITASVYAYFGRSIFIKLLSKITANQIQLENERREVNEKNILLMEAGAVKSKLLAVLSHDIRGPLGNIKSLIHLSELMRLNQEERKDFDKRILWSTEATLALLDNILRWSKGQISGDTVKIQAFDLGKLVDKVFGLYLDLARQKGIVLINAISPNTIILSDPAIIEMLLRNLVNNSVKFTESGHVKIGCQEEPKTFRIDVSDTGIGFGDPSSVEALGEGTHGEKGTGLGLVLCREYISKIDGELQIEKNTTGSNGTTISIVLRQDVVSSLREPTDNKLLQGIALV